MNKTKIEYCDMTVNPIIGCARGCPYCYAKKMNDRFRFVEDFEKPEYFPEQLRKLRMKQPKIIFMGSMSDVFGREILFNHREWLNEIFKECEKNYRHTYLFLTKNIHAYDDYNVPRGSNYWYGQTWDCKQTGLTKYDDITNTFISIEPILDEAKILDCLEWFKWVIIGAESGNRKGRVVPKREWIEQIVGECTAAKIPVFMKKSLGEIWQAPLIQQLPWEKNR